MHRAALTVDRYLDRNIDRNLAGTPEWTLALNELLARLMPSTSVRYATVPCQDIRPAAAADVAIW